jgi:hypothetical protein
MKGILTETNSDMAAITGRLTTVSQPLNMSVSRPFKGSVRKPYTQWMAEVEATARRLECGMTGQYELRTWCSGNWD